MSLVRLSDVLTPAMGGRYAVAGLVVQGWEDARAYVTAAEAEGLPVILQAGPGARAHTPLPVLGAMFTTLAKAALVPVVAHLDHGEDIEVCRAAIACGFTSVMFDGSRLPLAENIALTAKIARMARERSVSVEAELGFVGYAGGAASTGTDPAEARRFWAETGVDALAVSVGNTHLMAAPDADLDRAQVQAIAAACPGLPLVLHGGSGLDTATRHWLARETPVCKVNIGTELRQAFGKALREGLSRHPERFDRIEILAATMPAMTASARSALRSLAPPPF